MWFNNLNIWWLFVLKEMMSLCIHISINKSCKTYFFSCDMETQAHYQHKQWKMSIFRLYHSWSFIMNECMMSPDWALHEGYRCQIFFSRAIMVSISEKAHFQHVYREYNERAVSVAIDCSCFFLLCFSETSESLLCRTVYVVQRRWSFRGQTEALHTPSQVYIPRPKTPPGFFSPPTGRAPWSAAGFC